MIVKFFPHSKGKGSKPINYFLGNEKNREFARVLSGDPVVTEHLINATKFEHKYKSGVLSFTERADQISEIDKFRIMREFEQTLFPGLDPDQYDILWIEHSDKDIDTNNPVGRLELNFLIPCQELRTGKRLQPYYAAADKARVNAWKNIINREIRTISGEPLTDPNAPNRKRKVHNYIGAINRPSPYDITPKRTKSKDDLDTSSRDALRESINQHMLAMLSARGRLDDQKAVVHELTTGLGLTLERIAPTSITISHRACKDINGKPQRIRLEGGIYRKDFDAKDFTSKAQSDYETNHVRRRLRDDSIYADTMEKKTEYHKELYKDAVAPPKLDIAVQPVIMAQTPQKSTETLPVADTAPKRPIQRPR
ncbi:relaxase [Psychrobacter celer]|uniref:relaxase n=1 Tax=Psychrobacter celer TaxID=306572 RepID=UPI003FCFE0E4